MTIDEFAQQIRELIASIGIAEFQASFAYPDPRHISALARIPASEEQWDVLMANLCDSARQGEEYMAAFKAGEREFKVIRCTCFGNEKKSYVVD